MNYLISLNITNSINDLKPKVKEFIEETFFTHSYQIQDLNSFDLEKVKDSFLFVTDSYENFNLFFSSNTSCKNLCFINNNNLALPTKEGLNIYKVNMNEQETITVFRMTIVNKFLRRIKKITPKPFVSCICPSYNRRKFLPYLIYIFNLQDYPKECRELIILDDSPESNEDIIKEHDKDNNIRYYHYKNKLPIGKKRNIINQITHGEYIVCFDDDDYYYPERISHALERMEQENTLISGCSKLHVFYTKLSEIYLFGPYGKNHATNGTFAYNVKLLYFRYYQDIATCAEEKYFLNDFNLKLAQLNPNKNMLCISHNNNTFDKNKIIKSGRFCGSKLKHFIKDNKLLEFYKTLAKE
jgi:hypothetical protein